MRRPFAIVLAAVALAAAGMSARSQDRALDEKDRALIAAAWGNRVEEARRLIAAGADGVAVISALSLAPDPAKAAQDLRAVVDGALARRGRS